MGVSKRLLIVLAVAAAVLLGGACLIYVQMRTDGDRFDCAEDSGCIASHEYPDLRFSGRAAHPAVAFQRDTDRLAMVLVETGPSDSDGNPTARYTLLVVDAESGVIHRQTPIGEFDEEIELEGDPPMPLEVVVALSWNGHYAAVAHRQRADSAANLTVELMPLVGDAPRWERPMTTHGSTFPDQTLFDVGDQHFRVFNTSWTIDGQRTDEDSYPPETYEIWGSGPVKALDGTTAHRDGRTLEITQPDGRQSSHEIGVRSDQMLLSVDGSKLALWGTDDGTADGVGLLEIWDTRTGERLTNTEVPGIARAAWSPDSRRLAVVRDDHDGAGYALFSVGG
jgi:hypothetical protein